MLACLKGFAADVVFGPVYPDLDPSQRNDGALISQTFTQSSDRPTGTVIKPVSPLRVLLRRPYCYRTMATNNVLLDKSSCVASEEPFAPALGRSGGEDVLFFHNLHLSGKRIVWCREAVVFEHLPPERLRIDYILRKRYRNGQITSLTSIMTQPRQYSRLVMSMLFGVIQVIAGGVGLALFVFFSDRKAKLFLCTLAGGAGKLLWMKPFVRQSYGLSELVTQGIHPDALGRSS